MERNTDKNTLPCFVFIFVFIAAKVRYCFSADPFLIAQQFLSLLSHSVHIHLKRFARKALYSVHTFGSAAIRHRLHVNRTSKKKTLKQNTAAKCSIARITKGNFHRTLHMCTRQTCLQLICGARLCVGSVQTAGLINLFHLCDAIEWMHEHVAQLHSMLECELHVSYLRSQPMHTLERCVHNIFIAAATRMHRNSCALIQYLRTQIRLDSFSLSL